MAKRGQENPAPKKSAQDKSKKKTWAKQAKKDKSAAKGKKKAGSQGTKPQKKSPSKRKITLAPKELNRLYGVSSFLDGELENKLGLRIPCSVFMKDPLVADEDPRFGIDKSFLVAWEPGLAAGPTSARFAVVDYNGDTQSLLPPVSWSEKKKTFVGENGPICTKEKKDNTDADDDDVESSEDEAKSTGEDAEFAELRDDLQFHQVNVWAHLQYALSFFEEGNALGRRIPWGFDGNRLIVVPHAGYGENAFYDRKSKSLQFYYFGPEDQRVFTCLSTDIITHEFGHAVLDGIRPYYAETSSPETAAFHEFMGDLTAMLLVFRNNNFRRNLADKVQGDVAQADHLAFLATEFGSTLKDRPYLRTASNPETMSSIAGDYRPHHMSQVLLGAIFDLLARISENYQSEDYRGHHRISPRRAFWHTMQRIQRMALQPFDFLPPVEVSFRDYGLALLRSERLSNPLDPDRYFEKALDVFIEREIFDEADREELLEPQYLFEREQLTVFHGIDEISRSRASAYRFLHDNRQNLLIPSHQDLVVSDLYEANKLARQGRRMPRQIVLEYVWREEVYLDGIEFGRFQGKMTTMLCGGTLVFDEMGTVLSWFRKPGTQIQRDESLYLKRRNTKKEAAWRADVEEGERRRESFLSNIARQVRLGRIGVEHASPAGMLGRRMPPLTVDESHGAIQFRITPHLSVFDDDDTEEAGGSKWEISS